MVDAARECKSVSTSAIASNALVFGSHEGKGKEPEAACACNSLNAAQLLLSLVLRFPCPCRSPHVCQVYPGGLGFAAFTMRATPLSVIADLTHPTMCTVLLELLVQLTTEGLRLLSA